LLKSWFIQCRHIQILENIGINVAVIRNIQNNKEFIMKKAVTIVLSVLGGFIAGGLLTIMVVSAMAPSMMILEDQSKFGFEETIEALDVSIEKHNWKVPKVHDLQKTMKKYNFDVRPVKVYELCHPDHAAQILSESEERIVSSMMPCRVAVYEKADGKVYISRMNSGMMAGMMGGLIAEVMDTAASENEEILESILL
jgi:uncharacterized protein (DUF302 family)